MLLAIFAGRRLINLIALFDHFLWQDFVTVGLSKLVKFLFISMLQVQQIVEAGVHDTGPADNFLPVGEASSVMEGRFW